MKYFFILSFILLLSPLYSQELKPKDLIGTWSLKADTWTYIGNYGKSPEVIWNKADIGFQIKFVDEDSALIRLSYGDNEEIKCFYDVSIKKDTAESEASYRIYFTIKHNYDKRLYISKIGNIYKYVFIEYYGDGEFEWAITQGEMEKLIE
jgi:hypothetical protein